MPPTDAVPAVPNASLLQALVRCHTSDRFEPLHLTRTPLTARVLWCKCHADLEVRARHGYTPIMRAVFAANIPVIQELLRLGSDVNAQDDRGSSVVLAAALSEEKRIVLLLLEAGADVTVIDVHGASVLMVVCRWMDLDFIQMILEWGADPTVMYGARSMADVVNERDDIETIEKEAVLNILSAVGVRPGP